MGRSAGGISRGIEGLSVIPMVLKPFRYRCGLEELPGAGKMRSTDPLAACIVVSTGGRDSPSPAAGPAGLRPADSVSVFYWGKGVPSNQSVSGSFAPVVLSSFITGSSSSMEKKSWAFSITVPESLSTAIIYRGLSGIVKRISRVINAGTPPILIIQRHAQSIALKHSSSYSKHISLLGIRSRDA